jgi:hypothetical protein
MNETKWVERVARMVVCLNWTEFLVKNETFLDTES